MGDSETTRVVKPITKTYIIDNGRAYSLHTVYFVEAVAADFEPLFALYARAWPVTCLRCNSTYYQCRCKYREMAETCRIIAVSSSFDWRVGKAMTVADVMALIRGRSDAETAPIVASPQQQTVVSPSPSPSSLDANLDARLRVVETFAFSLDSKLSTHRQGIDDSLRAAFGQVREELSRIEAQITALSTTKPHDHSQDIAALRASISAVAAAHGVVVETPTIKMKQRRFLTSPVTVEGGYVVLYYNPRPEENPEIQVRANQPRMVWTGYSFTIPDGYVADIWSAGRCVASFAGSTGDGDFRIPVLGTSDAGLAVATGREVARLTLRRIEPVAVAIDRGGFGG